MLTREVHPAVIDTSFVAGQTATLALQSPNGTLGALMVGLPADRVEISGVIGDAWLDERTMWVPLLGVQNGAFSWSVPVPATWAFPKQFRWQGIVLDNGTLTLAD